MNSPARCGQMHRRTRPRRRTPLRTSSPRAHLYTKHAVILIARTEIKEKLTGDGVDAICSVDDDTRAPVPAVVVRVQHGPSREVIGVASPSRAARRVEQLACKQQNTYPSVKLPVRE